MVEPSGAFPPDAPQRSRPSPLKPKLVAVFFGPNGLRALWRLLIFFAILFALFSTEQAAMMAIAHRRVATTITELRAGLVLETEALQFLLVLFAAWVMTKIDRGKIADYGLPWQEAFGSRFWKGAAFGFASISALLLMLRAAEAFHLGPLALAGVAVVRYAIIWGLAFLFVAFFEEFISRGYVLFALAGGIGFWPAAIITSAIFGYMHHANNGESRVGELTAGAIGFLFCLLLRRTGSLWMPIGFHAAWDWGESYFYGVPDSGLLVRGHLFTASFSGPTWLTGGTVGPEGSWLCLMLIFLLFLMFCTALREVKYPNPAAIPDARRTH